MEVGHSKSPVSTQVLVALCLVLALGGSAFAYQAWQNKQSADTANQKQVDLQNQVVALQQAAKATVSPSPSTSPSASTAPSVTPTASATPDPTAGWSTYTASDKTFSFKYPKGAYVAPAVPDKLSTGYTLAVNTEKYASLPDAPYGYDSATAIQDKAALAKGDPSVRVGNGLGVSFKMISVPGTLAKESTILGVVDECNVLFSREAIIYKGDTRIRIGWQNVDRAGLTKANASYFTQNADCGTDLIWHDNQVAFYNDLVAGKTDATSQEWFTDFNKIVDSLSFN